MRCAAPLYLSCVVAIVAAFPASAADIAAAPTPSSATPPYLPAAYADSEKYPEPENPVSFDYLKLLWSDTVETATVPLHWDRGDWRNFGLIGGGLALTVVFIDKPVRDTAQHNRNASSDRFFRRIERFGTKQYALPVVAGFYAYGALADDSEAKATALDGFSASVISGLATSTLKGIFGRSRPNTGHGPTSFKPLHGGASFPSGHATGAFAVASVIATHYDDSLWIDATAYGIAGLVGVARLQQNAHWASDVVGGALIGATIGHHLVNFNRDLRSRYGALAPRVGTEGGQVTFSWDF